MMRTRKALSFELLGFVEMFGLIVLAFAQPVFEFSAKSSRSPNLGATP